MIKSIWFEIKMPEERERIMADIKDGYDSKDLTSMEDHYAKLHEVYGHHAPVYEGMRARWYSWRALMTH